MRAATVLVLAGLCARAALARPQLTLEVAVDPAGRIADGTVEIRIENTTTGPLDAIELWSFPARLARPSPALNDYNVHWYFPRSFDPAGMALSEVTVDGRVTPVIAVDVAPAGPGTILRLPLDGPLAPGAAAVVRARFRTRLPGRFGGFGCSYGACTLAGGFYPMPVELGPGGWDRSAPPALADATVTPRVPRNRVAVVQGRLTESGETRRLDGAPYVVLSVDRPLRASVLTHRGVTVTYLHRGAAPPPATPPGVAGPYLAPGAEDLAALVLADAREAIEMLHELGLDPPPGEVRLVEAPLKTEVAQAEAGVVLVSDRLYRLFPLDRFRKFHSFQFIRALYQVFLESRLRSRERPSDLAWAPDVAASWLVDLYTLRTFRRAEFAADVLKYAAFIPTIDLLLYAPQIAFAGAYFNTLEEPDPTREHPLRFMNDRPRGKTLYEKLRDRAGDEGVARIGRAMWQGTPVRAAAESVIGAPLDGFFAQWLAAYPTVDYRFELLASEPVPGAARLRHRIRLYKVGAHPPAEPVEVQAIEWGGRRHLLRWDGQGEEAVLTVETEHHLRSIELDPRGRLLETLGGNVDPRLDNRRPQPVKFIYNNLGALFSFQTLSLDLSLDFTLQRIFDLKNALRFLLFHSAVTQIGLATTYSRLFGRRITPARLSSGVSLGVTVSRLEGTFGRSGVPPEPGTRLIVAAGIGYDDRLYPWEPYRATAASLSASWGLTVPDGGAAQQQLSVGAAVERIQPFGPVGSGHGLALQLGAAITMGDLHEPSQMLAAGAPNGLRGYEPDELLGQLRVTARIEYRHLYAHGLDWNFLHLLYLRGVSGGLFAEAALISPCGSYSAGAQDLFADVGYSVRLHADWFGVSPTTFNLDFAVPLVRRQRGCFQDPASARSPASRAPVGFFVYFGPLW